ncbi:hypothetical protein ATS73_019275 [Pseudoalteromonas sp. H100]|nr:hypothetical protein [Pseudoalteromonas sp. H100]WFO20870.1 hypothetical protein ATS73_019275 [Pseudoalteromonas sp. H100]
MSITNDFTLDFKKGQLADLRKAISFKLGQQKDYSLKNVIKDFDEYRKIGKYINKHYSHQHRTQAVVSEIFNDSRNLDSISIRYFLALKQIKVVALLANILPAITDSTLRKQVALSSLIFSIRSLGSIDLLENLKKIAEVLKDNEAIKDQVKLLNGKTSQVDEINKYSNWSYTKSNHVTILKTAFSLYAASNGAKLGYHHIDLTKLANWKDPKEFDLDHIIPKSKYESTVEVSQARINEGAKTNSLGNMMLLGSVTNRNDKSNSIEFLVGEKDKPSDELSKYTHDVSLEDIEANKYIKGIRDIIARHNIETVSDKVSEQLADDVKDFNLKLIKELYTLNIIPLQGI